MQFWTNLTLYGSVSTSDVMMQGFYRDSLGRSESVAHYIARLEDKLYKIHVKHPNRASETETAGYIRDHLFYGLWIHLQEVIHAKFDKPMNNYMCARAQLISQHADAGQLNVLL